ncbi:TonB-dependent receptor domain-containing protein [Marinoscillum furvescens]|uniref:Fe(3+) dicitrate transport protein n=1 Tax=Marinoscillum furvescens DSM 4134 TaxID=1122208 RepID=A0A3D9L4E9_MARFU|nr:TonB-dependent receptor [Marinoscillum furvescens]REE00452.1 Fe(3+) dicitrate transport protein [Marinoscillum furvescens DSM 4134]
MIRALAIAVMCVVVFPGWAQQLAGILTDERGQALSGTIFVDGTGIKAMVGEDGTYQIAKVKPGAYRVVAFSPGYEAAYRDITFSVGSKHRIDFVLSELSTELDEIMVEDARGEELGIGWLESVTGSAIYEAKKTEVIRIDEVIGNKAANVGRQVYSRVPGLNIWENDGAGINLGIGGRGLNPNRTSNFNVRQNGYDISADALGYPESYYTPPVQALRRIEIVRGAAGLQYGTQFGGMLNFEFKEGPEDKKVELTSNQTVGSFGLFSSFNSLGGTVGKLNYYTFYQYKTSDGWRPNSQQDQHNFFGSFTYNFNPFLSVKVEHTHMKFLAQQPGGLTDREFYQDPTQSKRARNWFDVGWDLTAMEWDYRVSSRLKFNNRSFLLGANRYAVGNLGRIDRPDDPEQPRDLLKDRYQNWGNEFRVIYHYPLLGERSVLLLGNRLYFGKTLREQGEGYAGAEPNFSFQNPGEPEDSDFEFPSKNIALFAENVFNFTPKFSVTPGVRFEHIRTDAVGYYYDRREDLAGNIIYEEKVSEDKQKPRSFALLGIGMSYKHHELLELYGNISQNFRAINFNDIRVDNPSLKVDENIDDERGFNADLGMRGANQGKLRYDVSLFYLSYKNRIGSVLKKEPDPRFNYLVDRTFRFRTNVADAAIFGLESYLEGDLIELFQTPLDPDKQTLTAFINFAAIYSRYLSNAEPGIQGNEVELVPPVNIKTGITYKRNRFGLSYMYTYVREHYSDASNTDNNPPVPTAVEGTIPSYFVMDISTNYTYKFLTLEAGINNLTDEQYFTRRAAGYPGPGIIPAKPRNFYLGLEFQF